MAGKKIPSKVIIAGYLTGKPYYTYCHVRLDNNEIFYVGRGKIVSSGFKYRRAKTDAYRNSIWHRITDKTDYIVIVFSECDTLQEILGREINYVSMFGKIKDKTGTLSNITDGGDGALGLKHTEASKKKMSENNKGEKNPSFGRPVSEETRKLLSSINKGHSWFKEKGIRHPMERDVVKIDITTNKQVMEFSSLKAASVYEGIRPTGISQRIRRGTIVNNTIFKYKEDGC